MWTWDCRPTELSAEFIKTSSETHKLQYNYVWLYHYAAVQADPNRRKENSI